MKILVYEDNLSGHRLEYLHHFWEGTKLYPGNEYIFAVPESFKEKKPLLKWSECKNASLRYFDNRNLSKFKSALDLPTNLNYFHKKYLVYRKSLIFGLYKYLTICKRTLNH